MASHLVSLWKWDFLELGNGLHSKRQSCSLNMHLTSFCANLTASVVIKSLLAETGYRRFSRISNPEIQFYWELQKYGLLGQSPASGPEVVPGSCKNHPFTPFIAPIIFPSSFSPKSRENSVASMEIINSKVKARGEEWKCVSPPSVQPVFGSATAVISPMRVDISASFPDSPPRALILNSN